MGQCEDKVLLVPLQFIRKGLEELFIFAPVLAAAPQVQEAALHGAVIPVLLLGDKALISFVYGHSLPTDLLSGVKAVVTEHCLVQDVPPVFHGHICPTWGSVWVSSHRDQYTGLGCHQFLQGGFKYDLVLLIHLLDALNSAGCTSFEGYTSVSEGVEAGVPEISKTFLIILA
jgi:hypothetical protein